MLGKHGPLNTTGVFPRNTKREAVAPSTISVKRPRLAYLRPCQEPSDLALSFSWLGEIPAHLRRRLVWQPSSLFELPSGKLIVLMSAGKDDPASLDNALHMEDPRVSIHVLAMDIARNPMGHDITRDEPWNSLCSAAASGRMVFLGGSPELTTVTRDGACRTRGFSDLDFWGLPSNSPDDQRTLDLQSLAILRFMCLAQLAMRGSQGQAAIFLSEIEYHRPAVVPVDPAAPGTPVAPMDQGHDDKE